MNSAKDTGPSEELATELHEAIDAGRLQLYFQPIVSLADRVVTVVEALPRWPRGGREILAPSDFIDIAEAFRLLSELERWSIDAAFGYLARWSNGPPAGLVVALNLSRQHLLEGDLVETVRETARRNGVPPSRLILEIAETALLEAGPDRREKLCELSELGVGLTIDDYSSVIEAAILAELPTNALKISRRVVAGIPDGPRHTETAIAAIRTAGELGVKVIANGIESPGQLAALREMGCEYGQGFFFSIPMPAEVLEERALRR